jgi:wyosine [tRNA(Phe)-imidazoG37] synthetase (radical SAM superfamily)
MDGRLRAPRATEPPESPHESTASLAHRAGAERPNGSPLPTPTMTTFSELLDAIVRGPSVSDEFGRHLLIDPCCETNKPDTYPTQAVVVTTAARRLIEINKAGEKLKSVVLASAIDPMVNPEFREISENLRELVNKHHPKADLILFCDGLHLSDPEMRHSLVYFHKPTVQFEYGTQKTFAALTGRKPAEFKDVCENLNKLELEKWILRARFVRGGVDNSTDSEVRNWLKYVAEFDPASVQVVTPSKPNAADKTKPITKSRMEEIGALVTEKSGLEVELIVAD